MRFWCRVVQMSLWLLVNFLSQEWARSFFILFPNKNHEVLVISLFYIFIILSSMSPCMYSLHCYLPQVWCWEHVWNSYRNWTVISPPLQIVTKSSTEQIWILQQYLLQWLLVEINSSALFPESMCFFYATQLRVGPTGTSINVKLSQHFFPTMLE